MPVLCRTQNGQQFKFKTMEKVCRNHVSYLNLNPEGLRSSGGILTCCRGICSRHIAGPVPLTQLSQPLLFHLSQTHHPPPGQTRQLKNWNKLKSFLPARLQGSQGVLNTAFNYNCQKIVNHGGGANVEI